MSAYYQLLPTRPDGEPPSTTVRGEPPSFLSRLVTALPSLPFQLNPRYRSFPKFKRSRSLWTDASKRHIVFYYAAAGVSAAALTVLALIVIYQERVKEYIIDTYYGPAPPAACLRDPSAASSYVSWRPLAADDQLVYHCIKVPNLSELPPLRAYQSLPSTCREAFFENGKICNDGTSTTTFDLAWTWVNGSDPLLHGAIAAAEDDAGRDNGVGLKSGQKLYRCALFDHTPTRLPGRNTMRRRRRVYV